MRQIFFKSARAARRRKDKQSRGLQRFVASDDDRNIDAYVEEQATERLLLALEQEDGEELLMQVSSTDRRNVATGFTA